MKVIHLTLFRKFAFGATAIVVLFSIVNILILWRSGYKSIENEIDKRSIVLSRLIAEKVLQPIVYDDYVNVYKVIDQVKSNDSSIAYIFVLDESGKIISQNYDLKIPFTLIRANQLENGKFNIKVIEAKNFRNKVLRDIAYPILDGELGTIRIGFIDEDIRKDLNKISFQMLMMVGIFLIIGLIIAFLFSFAVTKPIKRISRNAQKVNLGTIESAVLDKRPLEYRSFFGFYLSDEMDILFRKFSEMIERLISNKNELQAARDSFVQAEKMASIGTLTAGISHEINNPLAGIKNCMGRIAKEPENVKQNIAYIELINEAIGKIENIIKPLLSFSRKPELIFKTTTLCSVIQSAMQLTEHRIRKCNIVVENNCQQDVLISTSVNHLEQVMVNLILNGVDAIEERKTTQENLQGKLWFSVSSDGIKTEIKVKDNGTGIPVRIMNQIFDPFFTTKELGKGTGLGLYVSYNIIRDLGGTLTVESTVGEGSEFIITFINY